MPTVKRFASLKAIAADVKDGDLIWIHAYHLMLLPAMLGEDIGSKWKFKLGFFQHIPLPKQ